MDPPDYARKMLEWMYQECKDVLDKKFKSQIKADFSASFAELYFAATTRIRYGHKIKHLADFGPDFYFPDFNLHCEVTSIKNGNSEFNSVPVFDDGVVHSYPEDKVILRLTGAIDQKLAKIKEYIKCGLISDEQPVLIFISANGMSERLPMHPEGGYPQIVKAVLPLGDQTFWLDPLTLQCSSVTYAWRDSVSKVKAGGFESIDTSLFLSEKSSCISAIAYSYATALDGDGVSDFGNDFLVIHNPMARNPLSLGFFKTGKQYLVDLMDGAFKIYQHNSP